MDARELRIGNFIEWNGNEVEVYNINRSTLRIYANEEMVDFGCDSEIYVHSYSETKPIPLTEQRLIDFGFLQSHNKYGNTFHIMNEDGFTAMFTVEYWTNVSETSMFKNHWHVFGLLNKNKIQHVHQLQNLYFALTGKELQLKQ